MNKMRKKKKNKQLRRTQRLSRGKTWLNNYKGEDIIEDYRKRYGVDLLCSVVELRLLGAEISEEYEHQLKQEEEYKRLSKKSKRKRNNQIEEDILDGFSDENFAFIVGYTSGGAPFGLTHWEMEFLSREEEDIGKSTLSYMLNFINLPIEIILKLKKESMVDLSLNQ